MCAPTARLTSSGPQLMTCLPPPGPGPSAGGRGRQAGVRHLGEGIRQQHVGQHDRPSPRPPPDTTATRPASGVSLMIPPSRIGPNGPGSSFTSSYTALPGRSPWTGDTALGMLLAANLNGGNLLVDRKVTHADQE